MFVRILSILMFTLVACGSLQKKLDSELVVGVGLLDSAYGSPYLSFDSVTIFRNDSLLTVWLPQNNQRDTLLVYPNAAQYNFKFKNALGSVVEKSVSVGSSQRKNTTLFLDSTDYLKHLDESWIAKLKDTETIKFVFNLQGCFNAGKDSVLLSRNEGAYFLQYGKEERKLNKEDIEYLTKFECELPLLPDQGFCTSTETYTLTYGSLKKEYVDSDCCWNGTQRFFAHFGFKQQNR